MEREKFNAFAKVLHSIQTAYINQNSSNKVQIADMIGNMKGDIRDMVGASIPKESIDYMITQLEGMSEILE